MRASDRFTKKQSRLDKEIISQVFESFARLEISDGLDARLDIRQCCLDKDQASMSDVVRIGQLIAVKVRTKAEAKGERRRHKAMEFTTLRLTRANER